MAQPLQDIVVLFGQPVAGNPTQYMIEKAFAQAGLDWRYITVEVPPEGLADAVRGFRAMGFRGANLTIPHKVAVIPLLDELTPAAQLMGAVNCLLRVGEKLVGENTDGKGFLLSLKEILDPAGKNFVIIGAGGAARAIAVEIGLTKPAKITLVNRTPERARPVVELLNQKVQTPADFVEWKGDFCVPPDTDVLINATSIGLNDPMARVPVDLSKVRPEMVAADVVFNPIDTRFLKDARGKGCRALDGLGMLVNQGIIGFRTWTGVEPDPIVMRDALEEFLSM